MLESDDLTALMEGAYKPEHPELLLPYYVEIETDNNEMWHGKVWQEREDGTGYVFITTVGNRGEGGPNYYDPLVVDRYAVFKRVCEKCYPTALDPMDFACVFMELREAWKELT